MMPKKDKKSQCAVTAGKERPAFEVLRTHAYALFCATPLKGSACSRHAAEAHVGMYTDNKDDSFLSCLVSAGFSPSTTSWHRECRIQSDN